MLVNSFMSNLNTNLSSLSKLQDQMSSGKKFAHISDDPVALIYSQQAKNKLTGLENYKANVDLASNWLKQAETGTMEVNNLLVSLYERTVDAATDVKNGADITNIASFVKEMRDQILDTLNSALGDKYVFGGYNTTGYTGDDGMPVPPFTVDDVTGHLCYNGVDLVDGDPALIEELRSDVLSFSVAIGTDMPVTVNGIDLAFYGKGTDANGNETNLNIYNLVDDLYNTLMTDGVTADDINNYISDLQKAQDHTLSVTAEIGGRVNRMEILESRYAQDELNYTQMLSDAEDADLAEVIMRYKMAEAVYNASLAAGASIIQPTLMDYLR